MLVKELMNSKVITVVPEATLQEAGRLMSVNSISNLVVVEGSKVLGVIKDGHLKQQRDLDLSVRDLMDSEIVTISQEKNIQIAAQALDDNNLDFIPVVDGSRNLVGIITSSDIVHGYVQEERTAKLSPESSAIYLSMTRTREYEDYWLDKIKGYGYRVAITQTGANAENLPVKLRESTTVAAIARGVIKENLREKMAVSNAVKDAYTQLNLVNPGLGGGFKVAIVRGEGRLAVAVFGKFGHALVDGPEQLSVGMSVV